MQLQTADAMLSAFVESKGRRGHECSFIIRELLPEDQLKVFRERMFRNHSYDVHRHTSAGVYTGEIPALGYFLHPRRYRKRVTACCKNTCTVCGSPPVDLDDLHEYSMSNDKWLETIVLAVTERSTRMNPKHKCNFTTGLLGLTKSEKADVADLRIKLPDYAITRCYSCKGGLVMIHPL